MDNKFAVNVQKKQIKTLAYFVSASFSPGIKIPKQGL